MSKLLAVDLDGTLFYPKQLGRCISRKNCKFLQNWYDSGNRIVLITSRSRSYLDRLKDEIDRPFDYITSGGAQIGANGELIRDVKMDNASIETILTKLNTMFNPVAYLMTCDNKPLLIRNNGVAGRFALFTYKLYWIFQFKYRENYILNNEKFDDALKNDAIYKIMVFYGLNKRKNKLAREANKKIREKYSDIEASWSYIVNELTPANCHKGIGLTMYCENQNINSDDVYVVGDSGNDIEMFNKFHEHSYCMKHGGKVVRKYAKHVIRRVHDLDKLVLKGELHE